MTAKYAIILAAGQGTRMKSKLYKVLHPVCGRPMVDHVLTQIEKNEMDKIVTIIGHGADKVKETLGNRTEYALQSEQLGTGHAVLQAEGILGDLDGMTLIACGDTPLFTAKTFSELFEYHKSKGAVATVLTAQAENPFGYGRIIRNEIGIVEKIVEQKDATKEEAAVKEINTGVYVFDNRELFHALHQIKNDNAQGEYYLTDVMEIFKNENKIVAAYRMKNFEESMGVNDRVALSKATKVMRQRINEGHMKNGVTIIDPDNTYIDCDVQIGSDTVIEPGVYLKGRTIVGNDCFIGANSEIVNSILDDEVTVTSSLIEEAHMQRKATLVLTAICVLWPISAKEFTSAISLKSRRQKLAKHQGRTFDLCGDATLGKEINVGCGTVFINYDGINKHHTNVGDYSFIGSGSNIIAPVEVGDHSYIAAGSTITNDVEPHDMAIARGRQVNKKGYYDRYPVAKAAAETEKNEKK